AGAGPFSSQPYGPGDFGRFSALFARAVSQRIQLLRSRLEKHPNSLRQVYSYLSSSTLGDIFLIPRLLGLPFQAMRWPSLILLLGILIPSVVAKPLSVS